MLEIQLLRVPSECNCNLCNCWVTVGLYCDTYKIPSRYAGSRDKGLTQMSWVRTKAYWKRGLLEQRPIVQTLVHLFMVPLNCRHFMCPSSYHYIRGPVEESIPTGRFCVFYQPWLLVPAEAPPPFPSLPLLCLKIWLTLKGPNPWLLSSDGSQAVPCWEISYLFKTVQAVLQKSSWLLPMGCIWCGSDRGCYQWGPSGAVLIGCYHWGPSGAVLIGAGPPCDSSVIWDLQ